MRYLSFLFLFLFLISCKKDTGIPAKLPVSTDTTATTAPIEKTIAAATNTALKIKDKAENNAITMYVEDIKSLSSSDSANPIEKFQTIAESTAVQKIVLTKKNFIEALKIAINFQHIFITVENHTVIKIEDLTKCQYSKSWATCIPYATGYIKKGDLVYQEGYANNIIGRPDNQKRTLYLFN